MPLNCGLSALNNIAQLKNVSMYTLIHLAKDNGINLYFCKVDKEKLPLVKRPAIFHSVDHFTLVENDKPLPPLEYTGWVLASSPMGVPLSHSLAKQITGGKKGGFFREIAPALIGLVSNIILPGSGIITGGLANIGFDQYAKSNHPEQLGAPGNPLDILGAGAVGALEGAATGGAISGFNSAGPGFLSKAGGALSGALTGALHPIASNPIFGSNAAGLFPSAGASSLASGVGAFNNGTSSALSSNVPGVGAASLAANSALPQAGAGTAGILSQPLTLSGASNPTNTTGSVNYPPLATNTNQAVNVPGGASSNVGNVAGAAGGTGAKTGLESIFGGISGNILPVAGMALASGIGKPPAPDYNVADQYNRAKELMGGSSLPAVTNDQLNKYLGMSIPDLKKELTTTGSNNAAQLELDKKYQQALADVQRAAANSGQSIETSSDARQHYDEVNRQWADAKANLAAQADQTATTQAVGVQQWALQQSIAQGQFDMTSAMNLAQQFGYSDQLKWAIQNQDYQSFQGIIAKLLAPQSSNPNAITVNLGGLK